MAPPPLPLHSPPSAPARTRTQARRATKHRGRRRFVVVLAGVALVVAALDLVATRQRVATPFRLEAAVESLELTVGGSGARPLFSRLLAIDAVDFAGVESFELPSSALSGEDPADRGRTRGIGRDPESVPTVSTFRATDGAGRLRLWQARPGAGGLGVLQAPWVEPSTRVRVDFGDERLGLRLSPSSELRVDLAVPCALRVEGVELVDPDGLRATPPSLLASIGPVELTPAHEVAASRIAGGSLSASLRPSLESTTLLAADRRAEAFDIALPIRRLELTPTAASPAGVGTLRAGRLEMPGRRGTRTVELAAGAALRVEALRGARLVSLRVDRRAGVLGLTVEGVAGRLETRDASGVVDLRPTVAERWLPVSGLAVGGWLGLVVVCALVVDRRLLRRAAP